MQDEQAEETDEAAEPTAEGTEDAEASAEDTEAATDDSPAEAEDADDGASEEDAGTAAAVDMSAAQSAGSTVLAAPEVPDDSNDKIAAAQKHIDNLNMDDERDAAERAQKSL